jgi:hypothetical protein
MVAIYVPTLSYGSGGFDSTKYQARLTMQKGLASTGPTSLGGAMKVANTVIAHMASFLNSASKIPGKNPFGFGNATAAGVLGSLGAVFGNNSIQANEAEAATIGKVLLMK